MVTKWTWPAYCRPLSNVIWMILQYFCSSDIFVMVWLFESTTHEKRTPDSARFSYMTSFSRRVSGEPAAAAGQGCLGNLNQNRVGFSFSFVGIRQTGWMETQQRTMSHNHAVDFTARLCIPGRQRNPVHSSTHTDTLSSIYGRLALCFYSQAPKTPEAKWISFSRTGKTKTLYGCSDGLHRAVMYMLDNLNTVIHWYITVEL